MCPASPSGITADQFLPSGSRATVAAATTTYLGPVGEAAAVANAAFVMNCVGTLHNLAVNLSAAPGAGLSTVATVFKNGAATTMVATVTGATATQASDLAHTVAVQLGDLIAVQVVTPAGAASAFVGASLALLG